MFSRMGETLPDMKVVLVGPPSCGKSSMILSLTSDAYKVISEHTPTVFDSYRAKVEGNNGQIYQLRYKKKSLQCFELNRAAYGTLVWTRKSVGAHFQELTPFSSVSR